MDNDAVSSSGRAPTPLGRQMRGMPSSLVFTGPPGAVVLILTEGREAVAERAMLEGWQVAMPFAVAALLILPASILLARIGLRRLREPGHSLEASAEM